MWYKNIEGDYLVSVSSPYGNTEITLAEYNQIVDLIAAVPNPPDGYYYRLKLDLTWELNPIEGYVQTDEIDDDEAIQIITGA